MAISEVFAFYKKSLHIPQCSICCHVFVEIGEDIALGLEGVGREGDAGGGGGPDAGGMVNEVVGKALGFDLFNGEVAGQLIDHGADHL